MPTETELRQPVCAALRKTGAIVVPYVGSMMGMEGASDIFLGSLYWQGWIEFKGPKTKLTTLQAKFIADMRQRKVNALVMRLMEHGTIKIEVDGGWYLYYWNTGWDIINALGNHTC
jgi:hypothetical protein